MYVKPCIIQNTMTLIDGTVRQSGTVKTGELKYTNLMGSGGKTGIKLQHYIYYQHYSESIITSNS